jgi:DNA replication protein DnaC
MRSETLEIRLKAFRLPSFLSNYIEAAQKADKAGWTHVPYLEALAEIEAQDRQNRKVGRMLKDSKLPVGKTLATLKLDRFPATARNQIKALAGGQFLAGSSNVCVFGNPGTGKTHIVSAIGHELVRQGHSVFFTPVGELVERLLAAKRDLRLTKELRRLDNFECIALDDIGYVQQGRDEMEVLFTLLAERYERKSVMITSNLVFSKWNQIFKDPMTTAAAIDRVVHYSVIVELAGVRSYREEEAAQSKRDRAEDPGETKRQGKGGGSK